ncbi:MAG: ribbon-helix-helix domain-containing protein, partial [Promethearchaeota archaeon]
MSEKKNKTPMRNITINIPEIYDENIQLLIERKLTASRSEAIRIAIREYLHREYDNLELLGYFDNKKKFNENLIKHAG